MVGWELIDGQELEAAIGRLFSEPRAAYLHVHYAAPGCYAARRPGVNPAREQKLIASPTSDGQITSICAWSLATV